MTPNHAGMKPPFIMLMDSVGGEFSQEAAGIVCLCSTVPGTSDGRLKKWRWLITGGLESSKGSASCLVVDSGYVDILNSGGWGLGHPHTLSSCSLGIHSTQWLLVSSKGEHPKAESQVELCFLFKPTLRSWLCVSFLQHSIHWGSDKGSLSFKGREIHFSSPWQGNGRTFGIQNIDAASYFYKIQFSTVCHLATQYTFLPLTHLSVKNP